MANNEHSEEDLFFEEIVKKTKTGITFPKELRDVMFNEDVEVYFKLKVPKDKSKIILEFISEPDAKNYTKISPSTTKKESKSKDRSKEEDEKTRAELAPNWAEYFVYDFKSQDKVKPILESAFYKFAETPINLEDAMGRVKYALVSFLSSTKTENAKLYFSVIKFLIDVIEKFNLSNLIEWIFEKIVPNIDSKFLYEQALLELIEVSLKTKRYEKAEVFIFYVLKNIDDYPKSELYNIFNSFKELVKKVKYVERTEKIDTLLKEKLLEYGAGVTDPDYKIQIVEFLEDLNYIEFAYKLAKEIQKGLPADSIKVQEIRKIIKRLYTTPITENKRE
jgi:hypothetical protein